jgi:hypothetical protein
LPEPHRFTPSHSEAAVVIIIIAVAFLWYATVWRQAPLLSLDSPRSMRLAREIKAGAMTELSIRTLGFPLFLILTGSEVTPGRALYFLSASLFLRSADYLAACLRYRKE